MAALTLLAFAVPGSVFLLTILLFWVWLGVMCAWLVRLILGYCRAAARGASLFDGRDSAGRWLHSPIVAVTTILLVALQVPHYVTFFVSLPHMRWVAAQQNSNWFMGCAGVYPVKRIEYPPWGMQFLVFGGGFMDDEGFAYSPNGPPAPVGENYYSHFWGDWYVWTESW